MSEQRLSDDFANLLISHQRPIYAFLVALIPDPTERDDVYQQTCLLLWEKRAEYDPARRFFPWACGFARNKAFEHLRRRRREAPALSPDTLVRIAAAREIGEPIAAARRMALDACIRKLSDQQAQHYAQQIVEMWATADARQSHDATLRRRQQHRRPWGPGRRR